MILGNFFFEGELDIYLKYLCYSKRSYSLLARLLFGLLILLDRNLA